MVNKEKSTFDKWMKDKEFEKSFNKEYKDFILSELIIALMEDDNKTVRKLANEIEVSPTIIQNIRSGKQNDIKMSNFMNIANACGYNVILEKDDKRIPIVYTNKNP